MVDVKKKKKKASFTEDDVFHLAQRYSPSTIITLLQEVAQFADVKIDWKTIVKKSSTGISNPREYQLLWRHLAYRDPLLEEIDGDEPMDDDSDLEFELEADPAVSDEVKSEIKACVKVLLSPRLPNESSPPNINPSDKEHAARPASKKNSSSVSLDEQSELTGLPNENFEGNEIAAVDSVNKKRKGVEFEGSDVGWTAKKKRKLWTEEEDTDLIAAVKKHGERNWAKILKGDFKHDRTPSQLSQRWSVLKKKLANSNTGRSNNSINLANSEVLDAARVALKSALKMPMARSSSPICLIPGAIQSTTPSNTASQSTSPSNMSTLPYTEVSEALCRPKSPQASNIQRQALNLPQETPNTPQNTPKTLPSSTETPMATSSLIKAAAFAAGGRMVAPCHAASLFKVVQSKNIVHVRAGDSKLTSPTSTKLQQRLGSFTMPPLTRNSPIISNRNTVTSQRTISATNAQKMSGKETPVSDGDGSDNCS